MKGLKASKVDITLIYTCPSCESEHYETISYVNKICKILCGCGEVLELKPIESFRVNPIYKETVPSSKATLKVSESEVKVEPPPSNEKSPDKSKPTPIFSSESLFNESINFLTAMGYKKKEASEKVKSASKKFQQDRSEQINEENFDEFAHLMIFDVPFDDVRSIR
jgi:hypothetical protein